MADTLEGSDALGPWESWEVGQCKPCEVPQGQAQGAALGLGWTQT